ncbi:MAG: hypothetical protein IJW21_03345 [Clostridia bacterium]|nr:hypothetical protein [Clostridia bacterium]
MKKIKLADGEYTVEPERNDEPAYCIAGFGIKDDLTVLSAMVTESRNDMKNKIITAISDIKKAGARKIQPGAAEYYSPFEKLYESGGEDFTAVIAFLRKDAETEAKTLLHALRISAHFGVETETLAKDMRSLYEKCFALMKSRDVWEARNGLFLSLEADELLKNFAGVEERHYFENFIFLAEVTDIQTAGLYDLCARLRLVKPTPKYIKDALRASGIIDGLCGTVPWQYYLEHASLAKIERDADALQRVGFVNIPKMLRDILAKMNEADFSSRKEKVRFCEKICAKNWALIKEITAQEENIIDEFIFSHNSY